MNDFFQSGPELGNQYQADRVLQSFLKRVLPAEIFQEIEADLNRLGERVVADLLKLSEAAEKSKPVHVPYDAWGRRIDHIETSSEWQALDRVAAEEKLVAIGYERKQGIHSRTYQFAKLYLFHPSSAIYTCPLAMTDGAARAIELYGNAELKNLAFKHLTSSDPDYFWTSGQWMTEKTGGSDVGTTETIAKLENGEYRLYGTKWFTSATTSQMALTLARIEGALAGGKGLSLFYVKLRDEKGALNRIQVNRLKDKLGTWALPTAELELQGTPAIKVGEEGNGIKKIASLFNITRIYNACCAVGNMRRCLALAESYAQKRIAFGKKLSDHGLHVETLADLQVEFEACFQLTFKTVQLLGKEELGQGEEGEYGLLRLLTPLAKLYTAKKGIVIASEILESFGGAGYIEDTGLPKLLRDSQVLSIWEGTTNVLSLDVLRALQKEKAAGPYFKDISERLSKATSKQLKPHIDFTQKAVQEVQTCLQSMTSASEEDQTTGARALALTLAQVYITSLLIEQADWSLKTEKDEKPLLVLSRWCEKNRVEINSATQKRRDESKKIFFSGFENV